MARTKKESVEQVQETMQTQAPVEKKKRGRPRKNPESASTAPKTARRTKTEDISEEPKERKVSKPKKTAAKSVEPPVADLNPRYSTAAMNEAMNTLFCELDETAQIDLLKSESIGKKLKTEILSLDEISREEVKLLVKQHYQIQDMRKALREQIRSLQTQYEGYTNATCLILDNTLKNMLIIETNIKQALEIICMKQPIGRWLLSIKGIGPLTAAGLIGYLDVKDKKYASHFISYAGLNDNNRPWLGREKSKTIVNEVIGDAKVITDEHVTEIAARTQWKYNYLLEKAYDPTKSKWSKDKLIKACSVIPYNKELKNLMWKIGESFRYLINDKDSLYGRLMNERRVRETQMNEEGRFAEQAAEKLRTTNIGKDTNAYKAYSEGKLPLAHINARASRYVQKIFISHVFEAMYRLEYNQKPPRYYALEHCEGQHNKEILPEVPYPPVTE